MINTEYFLSYCHKDTLIADEIENNLKGYNVTIYRDIRDIEYWESITSYMKKIRKIDKCILIISDSFLKSYKCMYEVLEFMKDENFKSKIRTFVIPNTNIYKYYDRIDYTNYWQEEYETYKKSIGFPNNTENYRNEIDELNIFRKISLDINEFLHILNDTKNPSSTIKDFCDIIIKKDNLYYNKNEKGFCKKGLIILLASFPGSGGSTMREILHTTMANGVEFAYAISTTTRLKSNREIEGLDYYFTSKEKFEDLIKNDEMMEYQEYMGNYYGTPYTYILDLIKQEKVVILPINSAHAIKIQNKHKDYENINIVSIMVKPPNKEELKRRLVLRGGDDDDHIKKQLDIYEESLRLEEYFDYSIVNDDIHKATDNLIKIAEVETLRLNKKYNIISRPL